MAVITISQGSFSGGRMLAEAVSRRLGYRCIDRQQVVEKAERWGVSQEELHTTMEKPPSFFGQSPHTKYRYLAFVQAALAQEVRRGNAIYHGLAAHLLLGKGQHVLRTRIIAPMEFRIGLVQLRQGYGRKEAIAYIERMDDERHKWTRYIYGVDWADASLYDLVINLEQMNLVDACDAVCGLAESSSFATTPEIQTSLNNLALSSSVRAHLAINHDTSGMEFEVIAEDGSVSVSGDIDSPAQIKTICNVVKTIPGVKQVSASALKLVTRI